MKKLSIATAAVAATAVASATLLGAAPAFASSTILIGYAGGSQVRVQDGTVTSDLTAASTVNTNHAGVSQSNRLADADVTGIVTDGTITTSSAAQAIDGGYQITSTVRVEHLNVLQGLATADALTTVTVAKIVDGATSFSSSTQTLNLVVGGRKMPAVLPNNLHLSVPGVAEIGLNNLVGRAAHNQVAAVGTGVAVNLLKARGKAPAGASVLLNSTYAAIGVTDDPGTGHVVGGQSFGTSVTAGAPMTHVKSDPTAVDNLPPAGTDGTTLTTGVANVRLAGALRVGAVSNTVSGVNTTSDYTSEVTSKVAAVNLFNGLVRARSITAAADAAGHAGRGYAVDGQSTLVGLVVGGRQIPVNVPANTTIALQKFARFTVNQQIAGARSMTVRAIDIVLTTAAYGLPAGAEIRIASATASAN